MKVTADPGPERIEVSAADTASIGMVETGTLDVALSVAEAAGLDAGAP
jgi:hypothetical protein